MKHGIIDALPHIIYGEFSKEKKECINLYTILGKNNLLVLRRFLEKIKAFI
jgi:hypothetical protein